MLKKWLTQFLDHLDCCGDVWPLDDDEERLHVAAGGVVAAELTGDAVPMCLSPGYVLPRKFAAGLSSQAATHQPGNATRDA